jgi:hypothetical protein
MKKTILILVALVALAVIGVFLFGRDSNSIDQNPPAATSTDLAATSTMVDDKRTVIGKSADGRDIVAYHYGAATGTEVLLVGGIHGGYSWNTAAVAYEAMAHLESNPSAVPSGVRVTVIPVVNPDGLSKVVAATTSFSAADVGDVSEATRVAGRFNGNEVDLNRNFDCDWQAEGVWQTRKVDGGDAAFSEPEAQALKSYVESRDIAAAVVWYSSAGGVFASNCHNGVLDGTKALLDVYAKASGYPAHEEFNFYEVTGDFTNWLAKRGTPAISVLLSDHQSTEWSKNRAGIEAALKHLAE